MTIERAVHRLVLPMLLASCLAQPAAAKMEKLVVAATPKTCTLTVADAQEPCTNYTFLTRADGIVRMFIIGDPDQIGFNGSSDARPTDDPFNFSVDVIGHRVGDDGTAYPASGQCELRISVGRGYARWISSAECSADCELGHVSVQFEGAEIPLSGY